MKFIPLAFLMLIFAAVNSLQAQSKSIYTFSTDSIAGTHKIDFEQYRGKKLLIVNVSSLDTNVSQLADLKKLFIKYRSQLNIILFPCTNFNSEPGSNKMIAAFLQHYQFPFAVAAKTSVKGNDAHPLYQWLTDKKKNGVSDNNINESFRKFLVDEKGKLVKTFGASERPNLKGVIAQTIENEKSK